MNNNGNSRELSAHVCCFELSCLSCQNEGSLLSKPDQWSNCEPVMTLIRFSQKIDRTMNPTRFSESKLIAFNQSIHFFEN